MHTQPEQENRLNTEGSDQLANTLVVNCGRALAQAVDEQDLLQSVCNTLVNNCGFRLAWFGYTEPGTSNSIRLVAQAGDRDGFLKETSGSETPATMAIEAGETCWIKAVADSPLVVPIRAAALKRGYTSVLSLPLKSDGRLFGALTIYADDPGKLDEPIVERLRQWSDLFALRVKTLRSHEERLYGREREVETLRAPGPTGTIEAPVEHLDLATVIKVSQAVSGEIVQEKQLEILMRTAIEQAGAERGVLVLSRWTEPRIAAQATTGDGGIVVKLHDEAMTPAVLPESVIQYVVRTNESVILDDAAAQNPFSADPYIRQQHARSILCLPFLNQGQLIGVLYLENNLTPGVFAPARIAVLKLLASQAAISLENARLYRDLEEREAKIRRLVEAQTPQAEDELRAIIDNAPVFLWSDLPDGYCDFLNQPWLTYFNLSLQEAQGAGWATALHPDDAAHHLESWQKSVSTGIPFETEARYRRSDGEYRWFLNRANPLRDKTGRIVKWYGTNIDIENLKRTEGRLRQSEAYLAEAQSLSHTGSFGWTPSTGEIHWSDESFRIFEYDRSIQPTIELVLQRIHPDDRAMMRQLFDETSRGEKDFDVTHRLLMPDGSAKFVHILSHAVKDAAGNLEIIGTLMDVTENTRLYRDLAEREAKIRRLVEANIIGIVVWNLEGRIIEANEAFLRIVKYSRGDLVSGRVSWREITPDKWRAADEQALTELAATGFCEPFEKEYFRKDGSCVSVLVGAALFEGRRDEGVAFVLDLTERKRAEEQLRRSAEELQRSESYLAEGQRLAHMGSWAFDAAGFDYWSPELFRMHGLEPASKAPTVQEYLDCVHPQDREFMAELIKRILAEPSRFDTTKRIVRPDGEVRYIRCVGTPIVENQALKKFVGTAIDVTEYELLTLELHRREAYLTDAQSAQSHRQLRLETCQRRDCLVRRNLSYLRVRPGG